MKHILLLLGTLITSAVIVGCGPAVGRAVGDTGTADGSTAAPVDVNVDQQLGDFKKEQDQQIQTVTKDFRSEVKETQILFSKQEEEFYTLKNAIDSLETELAIVKEIPRQAPDQPDTVDFKAQIEQNETFDKELILLHTRIDALEETANYLQSILVNLDERADQIQHTVEHLASEPRPDIEGDLEVLRGDIQAQLDSVFEHTNSIAGVMDQLDTDTRESLAGLSEEISTIGEPVYPISRDHHLAYENAYLSPDSVKDEGPCVGPNNLRKCIDDMMKESNLTAHVTEGNFASSAHKQMQVTFGDTCKVEATMGEIENSLGSVVSDWEIEGGNYKDLYDAAFISDKEWDLFKYLRDVHVGYC